MARARFDFILTSPAACGSVALLSPPGVTGERGRTSEATVDIQIRPASNGTILDLSGPLKMGEPEQALRAQVEELLESGTANLAINLSAVPEMDSSGIGALVRIYTSVKHRGGKCRLFSAPKRILQTLKMVRLDSVLELVDDEAAATRDF